MKCNEVRELMPDLAAGLSAAMPEFDQHLRSCSQCAGKLEEVRKTMALLDEWQAPEPSPYFDVRLQTRLREEMVHPGAGWLHWIRKPALALALTVLLAVGVTLLRTHSGVSENQAAVVAPPGTAVGDLQALDKNHDLYADFDLLDELEVQQDVMANP
jgi:predicted anti-sigma-YlaC factor YlaD